MNTDIQASLKAIALLLDYPTEPTHAMLATLHTPLDGICGLDASARDELALWLAEQRARDLLERQADYVDTFDRGRRQSLYLFEHLHGESRDRGQAMVELRKVYRRHGLEVVSSELPDYLPLFLEFCSQLPREESLAWLADIGHVLQRLYLRLRERESGYALLFLALLTLAGLDAEADSLQREIAGEERDDTPEAIDRVWREAPVMFGGGAIPAGCPATRFDRGSESGSVVPQAGGRK
jgi:nitrate reductase delta subunit